MRTIFLLEDLKGRDHLKNLGIHGMVILEWTLGKQCGKVWDWIHLAQDRDQ